MLFFGKKILFVSTAAILMIVTMSQAFSFAPKSQQIVSNEKDFKDLDIINTETLQYPLIQFTELLAGSLNRDTYQNWNIIGFEKFLSWILKENKIQDVSDASRIYSRTFQPMTDKPVILDQDSRSFFNDVEFFPEELFDGSFIGYKYVFLPHTVDRILRNQVTPLQRPIFFYFIKKILPEEARFLLKKGLILSAKTIQESEIIKKIELNIKEFAKAYSYYLFSKNDFVRRWFERLASIQDCDAQYWLGCMYYQGQGGKLSFKLAREYFTLSAKKGNLSALKTLALMLREGQGGEMDLVKAREYFKFLAELGDSDAQFIFALMLKNGEGGPEDLVKARNLLKIVADQRVFEAQTQLAHMAKRGQGGSQDSAEARKYFHLAADQGDPEAQFHYAWMAYSGEGGDVDWIEARNYFRKSALQRQPMGQLYYSWMLYQGEGGERNSEEAKKFLMLSGQKEVWPSSLALQEFDKK